MPYICNFQCEVVSSSSSQIPFMFGLTLEGRILKSGAACSLFLFFFLSFSYVVMIFSCGGPWHITWETLDLDIDRIVK
jgi:hypothetical protein